MLKCLVIFMSLFAAQRETSTEKKPLESTVYFPLHVGDQWEYILTDDKMQEGKAISVVKAYEKRDGKAFYRCEASLDGEVYLTTFYRQSKEGIFRHHFDGNRSQPSVLFLKQPIEFGVNWTQEVVIDDQTRKVTGKVSKALETTKVPAGEFKTIKIEFTIETATESTSSTYWLSANVGTVMQEFNTDESKVQAKLISYKLSEENDVPSTARPSKPK